MSAGRRGGAVRLLGACALAMVVLSPSPAVGAPAPHGDSAESTREPADDPGEDAARDAAADRDPAEDRPAEEQPTEDRTAQDRTAGEQTTEERTAEELTTEDRTAGDGVVSPEETATGEGDFGGASAGDALADGLAELRDRSAEAEEAEEAYRAAADRLRAARDRVASLTRGLADVRTELAEAQRLAGVLARQQYRDGGVELPAALRLLLGEEPAPQPHDQAVADRAVAAHVATLEALRAEEAKVADRARDERAALDVVQARADELRAERDEARRRLDEATAALADLSWSAPPLPPGSGAPDADATAPPDTAAPPDTVPPPDAADG